MPIDKILLAKLEDFLAEFGRDGEVALSNFIREYYYARNRRKGKRP